MDLSYLVKIDEKDCLVFKNSTRKTRAKQITPVSARKRISPPTPLISLKFQSPR